MIKVANWENPKYVCNRSDCDKMHNSYAELIMCERPGVAEFVKQFMGDFGTSNCEVKIVILCGGCGNNYYTIEDVSNCSISDNCPANGNNVDALYLYKCKICNEEKYATLHEEVTCKCNRSDY